MNAQKTPLVQKLMLVMLFLIFGCMVLLLINSRKQIEALRADSAPGPISNGVSGTRYPFPTMRSARRATPSVSTPTDVAPTPAPGPDPVSDPVPPAASDAAVVTSAPAITDEVVESTPASIYGRVLLAGTPPQEKVIRFDSSCATLHSNTVTTRHFVVAPDGGLANALVYVMGGGLERLKFPPAANSAALEIRNCMFEPYVLAVQTGQPITLNNLNDMLENPHFLPRVDGNGERNWAMQAGEVKTIAFAKPELFLKVKSEIHDWMFAYINVMPHPFFSITDTNGYFELPSALPSGNYEVRVAHLKGGTISQKIIYRKNTAMPLLFKLRVGDSNLALRSSTP
jgi:hypothetical protein